jgi:hypothetical protein
MLPEFTGRTKLIRIAFTLQVLQQSHCRSRERSQEPQKGDDLG